MIPATSVVEEEVVNFHSDLQRPFLTNHQTIIRFSIALSRPQQTDTDQS